ncbi:MAG: FeoB-associated Cys-rich membrane protein [Bacteroidales bacterium]|nr:FeoB-associated Cys-rich membrane protein [Bacteroidales bacterium]
MIQEIITYIIVALAVAFTVFRLIKTLKGNPPECECCKKKRKKSRL